MCTTASPGNNNNNKNRVENIIAIRSQFVVNSWYIKSTIIMSQNEKKELNFQLKNYSNCLAAALHRKLLKCMQQPHNINCSKIYFSLSLSSFCVFASFLLLFSPLENECIISIINAAVPFNNWSFTNLIFFTSIDYWPTVNSHYLVRGCSFIKSINNCEFWTLSFCCLSYNFISYWIFRQSKALVFLKSLTSLINVALFIGKNIFKKLRFVNWDHWLNGTMYDSSRVK